MASEQETRENSTPSILSCPLIRQGIGTTSCVILHGSKKSSTNSRKAKSDVTFCQECAAWAPRGKRGHSRTGRCKLGPPVDDHKWPITAHDDYCFSGIKEYDENGEKLNDETAAP